jgi:hypothetical protein
MQIDTWAVAYGGKTAENPAGQDIFPDDCYHLSESDTIPTLNKILETDSTYHEHEADTFWTYSGTLYVEDSYLTHDVPKIGFVYMTDFSEYTVAVQPSDWTDSWHSLLSDITVQADTWEGSSGKRLYLDSGANGEQFASWDVLDSLSADVEVLALVTGNAIASDNFRVAVRGSGGSGTETGYYTNVVGGAFQLEKVVNGTPSNIGSGLACSLENAKYYWIRFSAIGSTLKFKTWGYDFDEPDGWLVEETDTSITAAGKVGLSNFTGGSNFYCYYFACVTGGGSAEVSKATYVPEPQYYGPLEIGNNFSIYNVDWARAWAMDPPPGGYVYGFSIYQQDNYDTFRFALYSGGDTSTGPEGATLLQDFGLYGSGDPDDQYNHYRFSSPVAIPEGETLWVAIKGDSGYWTTYTGDDGDYGNWDPVGYYDSTAVSKTKTVAWAATWPSDGGSFTTTWPSVRLHSRWMPVDLVVADGDHLLVCDGPITITTDAAATDLVIQDPHHLLVCDGPITLTEVIDLAVAETYHDLVTDPVALIQEHTLTVAESYHDLICDGPIALTQKHDLAVAEAYHDLVCDGPVTLSLGLIANAESCFHLHDGENVVLTQEHDLVVAECYHDLVTDPVTLTQDHTLAVAETHHLHDADPADLTQEHTLAVAESYHDLVDDGPFALTQDHTLVVDESDHLHFGDQANVTMVTDLVVDSCDNLHVPDDSIILTALHILTAAECHHIHASPNLDLITIGTLSNLDADHLHDAENITLTYSVTLQNLDSDHLHVADASILECGHTIVLFDLGLGGSDDTDYDYGSRNTRQYYSTAKAFPNQGKIRFRLDAQPSYDVDLDNMSVGKRSGTTDDFDGAPTIVKFDGTAGGSVTAGNTKWSNWTAYTAKDGDFVMTNIWDVGGHKSVWVDSKARYHDNGSSGDLSTTQVVSFSGTTNSTFIAKIEVAPQTQTALVIAGDDLLHTADSIPTLNKVIDTINDGDHLLVTDPVALNQEHELAVNESYHLHDADLLALIIPLVVEEAHHLNVADNVDLVQASDLVVDETYHLLASDPVALTQEHSLVTAEAYHEHFADNVEMTGDAFIAVVGCDHEHFADNVALTQEHTLSIDSADNLHVADNVVLTTDYDISLSNSEHLHETDNIVLTQEHYLAVDEAFHVVTSDTFWVVQIDDLIVDDSAHLVASDSIDLTGAHYLVVQECGHASTIDDLIFLTQEHYLRMVDSHIVHLHYADNIWIVALPSTGIAGMNSLTPVRTLKSLTNRHSLNSLSSERTVQSITPRRTLNSLTAKRRLAA